MSVFDIITLLGGLAMFLYGMRLMGDNLKEDSSGTLKKFMEKVTNNPIKAFILGAAITAIIQSSTACIVLTAGLVAAGILSVRQSLGIIIGANVGTTITGQIIRLLDVNAGGNSFLQFFQPSTLAPLALILGVILIMFTKFPKSKPVGGIFVGFGILFTGLMNMTAAVGSLSESGVLEGLFRSIGDNMWLGYIIGAGVAFILQSSSATVGILQAFAMSSVIPFKTAYIVVVGVYLGDCVTTAIVCSIGANANQKRVGLINIVYNLGKTVLTILVVQILHAVGLLNSLWNMPMTSGTIANANTVFNLACAVVLLPTVGLLEKLAMRLVKDDPLPENKYADEINSLNPVFIATPALALNSCYEILKTILKLGMANVKKALDMFVHYEPVVILEINEEEEHIDILTDALTTYMSQLPPHINEPVHMQILHQYNKLATYFERIGDHAMNISETATRMDRQGKSFSKDAMAELKIAETLMDRLFSFTTQAFEKRDLDAALHIEPLEEVMDDMVNTLHDNHVVRLNAGICDEETGILYLDLLTNLERIADLCSDAGVSVITRVKPEMAAVAHNYITALHQGGNAQFTEEYHKAHNEFFSQLEMIDPSLRFEEAPEIN